MLKSSVRYKKTNWFVFIFVLMGFLVGLFIVFEKNLITKKKNVLISPASLSKKVIVNITPVLGLNTYIASPSPTITPIKSEITPTPVYIGYCLRVPVLLYHHIAPWPIAKAKGQTSLDVDSNIFDQQMGFLKAKGYTFYFAQDLVNALISHTALSQKPIVITIDDGYDDVYTYAYPVLKKYDIKATLFIPTGLLGVSSGANSYFSWDQLKDMLGSGLVMADNHTWSHFPMGTKGAAKDQYEIATAQSQIQQYTGKNSLTFAYPYGTNAGSGFVHNELISNGIKGAFSTISGTIQCDSFILSLHRTRIGSIPFPAFGIY